MNELIEKITKELLLASIAASEGHTHKFIYHWERSRQMETELLGLAQIAMHEAALRIYDLRIYDPVDFLNHLQ